MKLKQAQQIIEHHLEWINNGKQSEYKYTEEAFNEALQVLCREISDLIHERRITTELIFSLNKSFEVFNNKNIT